MQESVAITEQKDGAHVGNKRPLWNMRTSSRSCLPHPCHMCTLRHTCTDTLIMPMLSAHEPLAVSLKTDLLALP